MTKNNQANLMYEEYKKGFTLAEVGKMFGVTRQSVFCMFKVRNFKLRTKKKIPYQYFNCIKFTLRNTGYYAMTSGKRESMHRYVWKFYNGKIPANCDVHHKDRNKANNKIKNLKLMSHVEHARKYATGNNQYMKKVFR